MKRFFNRETLFTLIAVAIYLALVLAGSLTTVFFTDKLLSVFTGEALPMAAIIDATVILFAATAVTFILPIKIYPTYSFVWTTITYVTVSIMHSIYGMPFTTVQYAFIASMYVIGIAAVIVLPRIKKLKPFMEFVKSENAVRVNDYMKLSVTVLKSSLEIIVHCHSDRKKKNSEEYHDRLEKLNDDLVGLSKDICKPLNLELKEEIKEETKEETMTSDRDKCARMLETIKLHIRALSIEIEDPNVLGLMDCYIPLWRIENSPMDAIGYSPFADSDKIFMLYGRNPITGEFLDNSVEEIFRRANQIMFDSISNKVTDIYEAVNSSNLPEEWTSDNLKKLDNLSDLLIKFRSDNQDAF